MKAHIKTISPGSRSPSFLRLLAVYLPAITVVWIIFKFFYPYADFFDDSYTYLRAAADHSVVSFRPIGYSLFLRWMHGIWASDTFLVTFQYYLLQLACLYFLFSLRRWFGMPIATERILLVLLILDIPALYLCNCLCSDAPFTALSLIWIVELFRQMERPSWRRLPLQSILLVLIFYLRFSALYYPVLAAAAILMSVPKGNRQQAIAFKITGISASALIVVAAMTITRNLTRQATGTAVFSAFSGWQIANNALNIYPYIPVDTAGLPSPECRELALDLVRPYFDSAATSLRMSPPSATTKYMWEQTSPLGQYLIRCALRSRNPTYFKMWNKVSPVLSQYGYWIIGKHPLAFTKYYLWPNTKSFFFPILEVFYWYNQDQKQFSPLARNWFHYRTLTPKVCSFTVQNYIMTPFRFVFLFINLVFLLTAFLYLGDKNLRTANPAGTRALAWTGIYFLVNTSFSVFATPGAFRYEILHGILLFMVTSYSLAIWRDHRRSLRNPYYP